jgi:hypothetical protein
VQLFWPKIARCTEIPGCASGKAAALRQVRKGLCRLATLPKFGAVKNKSAAAVAVLSQLLPLAQLRFPIRVSKNAIRNPIV